MTRVTFEVAFGRRRVYGEAPSGREVSALATPSSAPTGTGTPLATCLAGVAGVACRCRSA